MKRARDVKQRCVVGDTLTVPGAHSQQGSDGVIRLSELRRGSACLALEAYQEDLYAVPEYLGAVAEGIRIQLVSICSRKRAFSYRLELSTYLDGTS